ncbi:MAG: TetR/AcrR family transcriptional regulator [Sphingomonadales bacterium]|nr:TetR/AcrR family transcriptional regulator [Sphingomonadales bacterium]
MPAASRPDPAAKPARRRSGREVVERLKDAASEEFGHNGFSRAKTADIARRAGVSETLLFKHFGSKANLFNDTVFNAIEQHFAAFADSHPIDTEGNRRTVSTQYIGEMQAFLRDQADAILLLVMSKAFEPEDVNGIDKVAGLHRYLQKTSDIVRSRTEGTPRVDPGLVACIAFGAILSSEIFQDWLFPEGWGSPDDIHAAVAEFVLGGLQASLAPR